MNKTHAAAHVGVPFAVVVGGSLATLAIIGPGPGRHVAATRRPAPAVTVTAPAPEPARTTVVARPSVMPTSAAVVPVSGQTAAMPHNADGGLSHSQARPPSTSQPSPAAPCSGVLSVRLLRAACVKIGGGA